MSSGFTALTFQLCLSCFLHVVVANHSMKFAWPCPEKCNCFSQDDSASEFIQYKLESNERANITTCQRQWLKHIPVGISQWTTDLQLTYNQLSTLNRSSFHNLFELRSIKLANNNLRSFANDTFLDLLKLSYLDLSNNLLTTIPYGSLCLWQPETVKLPCPAVTDEKIRKLLLLLKGNKWRCTCYLQRFLGNYSCSKVYDQSCISFKRISESTENIGFCSSPSNLIHVPLNRLSADELQVAPGRGRTVVNTCVMRAAKIDIALLVVIFSWMGGTIFYVLHFVRWNNREIAHHKSYISSLDSCSNMKANKEKAPSGSTDAIGVHAPASTTNKQKRRSSCTSKERETSTLLVKEKFNKGQPSHLRQSSFSLMLPDKDSPVWKPRNSVHSYQWDRPTSA